MLPTVLTVMLITAAVFVQKVTHNIGKSFIFKCKKNYVTGEKKLMFKVTQNFLLFKISIEEKDKQVYMQKLLFPRSQT